MIESKYIHCGGADISPDDWWKLRDITIASELRDSPNRTEDEVRYFIDRESADYGTVAAVNAYEARHRHPNTERGRRFLREQWFGRSAFTLLVSRSDASVAGMIYGANNTSGNFALRHQKRLPSSLKKYYWIGGVTLSPQLIEGPSKRLRAKEALLSKHLAEFTLGGQSATMYPSPSEDLGFIELLQSMGFRATDSEEETPGHAQEAAYAVGNMYGTDAAPATQVRMVQTHRARFKYTNIRNSVLENYPRKSVD